ncbi:MAG TPA: MBL fold metallo-hydrolase [Candidatus Saccharibacteria bacterium]|nr:MBL fold metallo-hydrolase [Candidatus Saccharibacteria bacterium]
MFEIEYKGANTVNVSTKQGTVVVDPKLSLVGLKDASIAGAIVLLSEERFKPENTSTARLVIDSPGEFGVAAFDIKGIAAQRHIDNTMEPFQSTIYRVEVGDVRIAILGNITKDLSEEQYEEIGMVDIVIVPVGGSGYTLDAVDASKIVRQIDPKVVIPVHYADSQLKYEVPQDSLDDFTKELGAPLETVGKYKLKQASQLPQVMTIVVVERS